MPVSLKCAIVHILDASSGVPIISDTLLTLDKEVADYITCVIDKSFHSDDAKECLFKTESTFWSGCQSADWNVLAISQSIASEMYNIIHRNREIPSGDVIMGISEIDGIDYFYALKIDYRTSFTHIVRSEQDRADVRIIRYKTLMPSQASKVSEGFFINTKSSTAKIIEKKFTIDGIKDFYISTQILDCIENKTTRQKTSKIMQVAKKVAKLYYDAEDTIDVQISSAMLDELHEEQPCRVKALSKKFFVDNPAAQEEFLGRLAAADITPDEELSFSERYQKKYEKQAIRTSSGVEIKIPTQLYSNSDEIEFINNPDGTVSLLIKNIKM